LNREKNISVNFVLSEYLNEYLNAIIMANTHRSRSEIVRDALNYYIQNQLDPKIKKNAEKILKIRKACQKELEKRE